MAKTTRLDIITCTLHESKNQFNLAYNSDPFHTHAKCSIYYNCGPTSVYEDLPEKKRCV